jgi:hypothetical protein
MGLTALDHWTPIAAFLERHAYPPGNAPQDHHPKPFGPIKSHWYGSRSGWEVVVHTTKRLPDGWSYNVAVERESPHWVSWFHNAKTGVRLRHLGLDGERLAHAFGVPLPAAFGVR